MLRVPGHSRRYKDIHKIAAHMLKNGIDAYDKLLQYFEARAFDILLVRDGSRFARTQSLHSYVTEETIDIGARIYSIADGMIDASNYRMWAAMSGFAASTEIDNLKKRTRIGMEQRAKLGKPTAPLDTLTHRKVRDSRGHSYSYVVREDTRAAWNIIIDELLQSKSYFQIVRSLQLEHGIPPVIGEAWYGKTIQAALLNPITWGHVARYYRKQNGIWVFDESIPPPDGVLITRNAHEPYWTGEAAVRIQNELRRRHDVTHGRAFAFGVHDFSGLIYCASCGRRMTYRNQQAKHWEAYTCALRYDAKRMDYAPRCTGAAKSIQVTKIREWLTPRLAALLTGSPVTPPTRDYSREISTLQKELDALGKVLGGLYSQKTGIPLDSLEFLQAEINAKQERVTAIKNTISQLTREEHISAQRVAAASAAVNAMHGVTVHDLWRLPSPKINQLLHGLLNGGRIMILEGEVSEIRWGVG